MRTFSNVPLPDSLLDQWKRWERGRNRPDEFYRPLIAATFGTVVESIFGEHKPVVRQSTNDLLIARNGMDTHELVQRIRRSTVDNGTLDALSITVEQLRCEYGSRDPIELIAESRNWLGRITKLLDERLTLSQHRDILDSAGWLTLLIGCLEFDSGFPRQANTTRAAALQLGNEAGNQAIIGWAHEMRSWFALTGSRFREVIEAAQAGQDAAPGRSVTVQLLAQEAKAWARIGNQRNVTRALEKGRTLLDSLPYPERPDDHFIVDPDKFDYYSMDCYRIIGDNQLAEMLALETLRKATTLNGEVLAPMRKAEAEITLGVVAARSGDIDQALAFGRAALSINRRSRPSLLLVGAELDSALQKVHANDPGAIEFHNELVRATSNQD
jgi:tetratricopeptide (TPR) repeat protein